MYINLPQNIIIYLIIVYLTTLSQLLLAPNERMTGEWWIRKDVKESGCGLILRYYVGICLQGLRNTIKNLSQDGRCPGWELNPEPLEYEYHDVRSQYMWQKVKTM
jgi:hypothetical protein